MNNFPNQNPGFNYQYMQEMQRMAYYKQKRSKDIGSLILTGVLLGAAVLAYLFIQTVFILILKYSPYYDLYENSPIFQNCFNVVAVHLTSMLIPFLILAALTKKNREGRPLVPLKKLGFLKTAAWTALGMGGCIIADYSVSFVMKAVEKVGYKLTQPETLKSDSIIACVTLVISTAVVPAIFEEFAFRCCALGALRKYGKGFAVFAVSIVFGLIHGNVIQFIFAFLIGLVLGFVTVITDSVLPAMLIHGFNNGLSVTQEILNYTSGEKVSGYVIGGLFVFWVISAIAGLIYLGLTKQFKPVQTNKVKEPYALSFGAKFACLLPGLFIPFLILIKLTSYYIEKL